MKIEIFEKKNTEEMVKLYMKVYGAERERAEKVIHYSLSESPEFCFEALSEEGECAGAVFVHIDPTWEGKALYIETIQVKPEYQKKGIGSRLLKRVIEQAKKEEATSVFFSMDNNNRKQREWYESFGFKPTKWICYSAEIQDL
jgi:ribosomal-protein-alanine N-acetyltransferase